MRKRWKLLAVAVALGAAVIGGLAVSARADGPSVAGVGPLQGGVGTSVMIIGSGLSGATDVRFNGTSASTFSVDSDSQIRAVVPAGATTGPISVVTRHGTATSDQPFLFIPIQHVVFIVQENHAFNDMLGKYCVEQAQGLIVRDGLNQGCTGAAQATISNGGTYDLTPQPDFGMRVSHNIQAQVKAMHGGSMDRFNLIRAARRPAIRPTAV